MFPRVDDSDIGGLKATILAALCAKRVSMVATSGPLLAVREYTPSDSFEGNVKVRCRFGGLRSDVDGKVLLAMLRRRYR